MWASWQEGAGAGQAAATCGKLGQDCRTGEPPHPRGLAGGERASPRFWSREAEWLGPTEEGRGAGRQGGREPSQEADVRAAEIGSGGIKVSAQARGDAVPQTSADWSQRAP